MGWLACTYFMTRICQGFWSTGFRSVCLVYGLLVLFPTTKKSASTMPTSPYLVAIFDNHTIPECFGDAAMQHACAKWHLAAHSCSFSSVAMPTASQVLQNDSKEPVTSSDIEWHRVTSFQKHFLYHNGQGRPTLDLVLLVCSRNNGLKVNLQELVEPGVPATDEPGLKSLSYRLLVQPQADFGVPNFLGDLKP